MLVVARQAFGGDDGLEVLIDHSLITDRLGVAQVGARGTIDLREHEGQDLAVDVRPGHLVLEVELDLHGVADVAELHRLDAGLLERALFQVGWLERAQTVAEGAAGDAQHVVDSLVAVVDRSLCLDSENNLADCQVVRDFPLLIRHFEPSIVAHLRLSVRNGATFSVYATR